LVEYYAPNSSTIEPKDYEKKFHPLVKAQWFISGGAIVHLRLLGNDFGERMLEVE
jgi:hypothetical protein